MSLQWLIHSFTSRNTTHRRDFRPPTSDQRNPVPLSPKKPPHREQTPRKQPQTLLKPSAAAFETIFVVYCSVIVSGRARSAVVRRSSSQWSNCQFTFLVWMMIIGYVVGGVGTEPAGRWTITRPATQQVRTSNNLRPDVRHVLYLRAQSS